MYSAIEARELTLGPLQATAKSKSAPVFVNGAPLRAMLATPQAPLRIPFEWGNFDQSDSARVQLCLEIPDDLRAWVESLESLAALAVADRSQELFKRKVSPEDARRTMCSALRTTDGTLLKLKVNRAGPNVVRVWTPEGAEAAVPAVTRNSFCAPVVELKSLWVNASQWGLLWQISDAIFVQPPKAFPWGA